MTKKQFTPKLESALAAKLRPISAKLKTGLNTHKLPLLGSVMDLKGDGEDHINIWNRSRNVLGASMSQFSALEFRHPVFKNFASVESYWAWLVTSNHDDRLRNMVGHELQILYRSLRKTRVPNLHAMIMYASWLKTKHHIEISKLLKESTLPFDCYYVERKDSRIRIRPPYALWIVHGWEEIRRAIKEKREPSFEFLREEGVEGEDIHQPFINALGLLNEDKTKACEEDELGGEGQGGEVGVSATAPVTDELGGEGQGGEVGVSTTAPVTEDSISISGDGRTDSTALVTGDLIVTPSTVIAQDGLENGSTTRHVSMM